MIQDIKEKIKEFTFQSLKTNFSNFDNYEMITIEHPKENKFGDYSFTGLIKIFSDFKKRNPDQKDLDLNNTQASLLQVMNQNLPPEISKVEIAGPGYINFYLSRDFFTESVKNVDENFGKNKNLEGKKMMVEYTDPNPFKPFHIGHLMSNAIGESISRLIEFSGAETIRANYQGDIGLHVAKAIWGLKKKEEETSKYFKENLSGSVVARYIGECYSFASNLYEEDENIKKEINEINKKLYARNDSKINELYDWGMKITLGAFEEIYKMLGTKFQYYFFESGMAPIGIKIVKENTGKVFEESDGAVIFKAEKYDPKLHTRVFINSQGLPTYETKEIGLTYTKFEKENPDLSIVITANEQGEYMKVVQKALSIINPEYEKRMHHIVHGMMRFAEGKMSSRKGNVITGESLLNDARLLVRQKMEDRVFSEEEKFRISNQVAVSALKYSILKQATGGDIIYDFEKSISFEGDSGPYLQYTFTRANSVLNKADITPDTINAPDEVFEVEKILYRFPEIVARAQKEYQPHYIANYLIDLARSFNSFYGNNQILNKEDEFSPYKLAITSAVTTVLKNGLYLLGIEAPEKM